jgi:hypothetical protein
MNNSEKDKVPDVADLDKGDKRPKMWGSFYLITGIIGLGVSIYSGFYDFKNIVPLFGTVIAGVLIAALSILMIIYGFRLFKKDI